MNALRTKLRLWWARSDLPGERATGWFAQGFFWLAYALAGASMPAPDLLLAALFPAALAALLVRDDLRSGWHLAGVLTATVALLIHLGAARLYGVSMGDAALAVLAMGGLLAGVFGRRFGIVGTLTPAELEEQGRTLERPDGEELPPDQPFFEWAPDRGQWNVPSLVVATALVFAAAWFGLPQLADGLYAVLPGLVAGPLAAAAAMLLALLYLGTLDTNPRFTLRFHRLLPLFAGAVLFLHAAMAHGHGAGRVETMTRALYASEALPLGLGLAVGLAAALPVGLRWAGSRSESESEDDTPNFDFHE